MKKKSTGKKIFSEYRSLQDDMISSMIKETLGNRIIVSSRELEQGDLPWIDEANNENTIQEEKTATPENVNQEFLTAYFDGHINLSDTVIGAYIMEKRANSPNYPLLRRYYKKGNPALKALLLKALDQFPTDKSLLHDLAFFHEHQQMLSELIARYTLACKLENSVPDFTELAMDFYYNTINDGFDAFHGLKETLHGVPQKQAVIEKLVSEHGRSNMVPNNTIVIK